MGKLDGKVALVTGGTSGIGGSSAELFAKEGADVIVVGRNVEKGKAKEEVIRNAGYKATFFQCDVSKLNDVKALFAKVKSKYGKLDILFNNAGIFATCYLENITNEEMDKVYQINLGSVINMTQTFILMLEINGGVILNNASIGGLEDHTAGRSTYLYASSKAAVIKFTKLCALNYAKKIRVNCICPGITNTPIYTNRDFTRFKGIPMERVARPEEIAKAALFLVSEDSSYITGAVLPVDGGATL